MTALDRHSYALNMHDVIRIIYQHPVAFVSSLLHSSLSLMQIYLHSLSLLKLKNQS